MEVKSPLPVNPHGLIRSYVARQHTMPLPAQVPHTPVQSQPVAPLFSVPHPVPTTISQLMTAPLPVVAPAVGTHNRHNPVTQLAQQPIVLSPTPPLPKEPQVPQALVSSSPTPDLTTPAVAEGASIAEVGTPPTRRRALMRIVPAIAAVIFALICYSIWHSSTTPTTAPAVIQQHFATSASTTVTDTAATSGTIESYITGAVKNPGVYTLANGARVYELLQRAGGPLPNANLIALNLAAKLSDGEEIYVLTIGETPPASLGNAPGPPASNQGQSGGLLVNINTASVTTLRNQLHVSASTAQKIFDYRQQHGNYTTIDQLLLVVSHSIYDKVKTLITT